MWCSFKKWNNATHKTIKFSIYYKQFKVNRTFIMEICICNMWNVWTYELGPNTLFVQEQIIKFFLLHYTWQVCANMNEIKHDSCMLFFNCMDWSVVFPGSFTAGNCETFAYPAWFRYFSPLVLVGTLSTLTDCPLFHLILILKGGSGHFQRLLTAVNPKYTHFSLE